MSILWQSYTLFILAAVVAVLGYVTGFQKTKRLINKHQTTARTGSSSFHSRPQHHAGFVALSALLPVLFVALAASWIVPSLAKQRAINHYETQTGQVVEGLKKDVFLRDITSQQALNPNAAASEARAVYAKTWKSGKQLAFVFALAAGLAGWAWGRHQITPDFRARVYVERAVQMGLIACSAVAVLTTVGIVLSLIAETARFFSLYPVFDFLTGLQWSPQIAFRADQGGGSGAFGMVPLLGGTLLITAIAMLVAGPVGLFAAIYMAEYANRNVRAAIKPVLEILAGIPTVVFGFFAALTVAPAIRGFGESIGLSVASESALAAGIVMGVMIIPFVSSISDDVISAVPQALRDGSYAMGATPSETIRKVVLPAALPGIASGMMLAISRAIGETMIVVMAAGLTANLTLNPLEAVTTFTVQIKTLLVGDQEFDSVKTLSAFALGFVLFFVTLTLNVIALRIVKKYREQYD